MGLRRLGGWPWVVVLLAVACPVTAQKVSGTPGSPSATESLQSKTLPPPPAPFGGVIGLDAKHSKAWWPPTVVPPKGAPNVLLIITDDQGYGVTSTFGGVIPTPAMDKVAKRGLRYTQFHSTALCSPSRAALITGKNHHSVGFGVIAEQATGFPGYDATIGLENGTVGQILRENGYATSWFGKSHNTPDFQYSMAGPFDQWPTGMGFDYFYGFMGGETDQYAPYLFRNTTPVFPWVNKPNYNLGADLADDAIRYLRELNASAPDKPFLLYFAPGGTHAPHQPPPEWIAKFKGKFDMGWNAMREQIFANQKRLGVIPADTQLTAWPDALPKWESLKPEEKKLFARQAEVFAAYTAYTDYQIGRVVDEVEALGKLDNTLVIYIAGDNGTSAEGTVLGTPFDMAALQGVSIPVEEQLKFYDAWGSAKTAPHMSVGWTWAFDCPFKWTKQVASHFGGTRQGMAVAWPKHIQDVGGIRNQFHHLVDVTPTILEATGVPAPATLDGVAQKPMEGVSMAYTWDQANAHAKSKRTSQYFEIFGNRAIYSDGWIACTTPPQPPWLMGAAKMPDVVNGYTWELYDLDHDYSEANDLASKQPEKLKSMQELFLVEASKYNVFPLDNDVLGRIAAPRPSATAGRTLFTYEGVLSNVPAANSANIIGKSYVITADVEVPKKADGVIVTSGGRFGGYGLYLLQGRPVFTYNLFGLERFRWEGKTALAPGRHKVVFDFKYEGPGVGKGGTGTLSADDKPLETRHIPHTVPAVLTFDETFDVGTDTRTPVDDRDYQVPFSFTGKVERLTIQLKAPPAVAEDGHGPPSSGAGGSP